MTERPILFSAPMVRALLAGTKTQTRRAMKPQPSEDFSVLAVEWYSPVFVDRRGEEREGADIFGVYGDEEGYKCPYGAPGDRLWVRESGWERPERTPRMLREGADTWARYYYDADAHDVESLKEWGFKRRPSIHMPRWASRLTLEITGVRVEQLQDISATDAWAEGIPHSPDVNPLHEYEELWNAINGKGAWNENPWVWVIEFRAGNEEVPVR